MKRTVNNKKQISKKENKKTTNILELIDYMEEIDNEKKKLVKNINSDNDIEENEYSDEIIQINKDDIEENSNQNELNEIILL